MLRNLHQFLTTLWIILQRNLVYFVCYYQAQWIHRFEACQKFFNKLSAEDVVAFTDDVTFSENAIDKLSEDIRMQIINRVMKYARQQKAQEEKQGNIKEDRFVSCYWFVCRKTAT